MWIKLISLVLFLTTSSFCLKPPTGEFGKLFDDETSDVEENDDEISYRLPNNTRPVYYEVYLETDIHSGEFGFNGLVRIRVEVLETTSSITLHHRQLNIERVDLRRDSGTSLQANVEIEYDEELEFLMIKPRFPIGVGTFVWVEITYSGTLRGDQAGFYRSSYKDANEVDHWLAVTQLESTDARHAFPCYDEPGRRTPFKISIRHHKSYSAISNMPVESEEDDGDNYVTTYFEETPPVQTYLIAFLISDFTFEEDDATPTPHRVFAKPSSIDSGYGKLSIGVSSSILHELELYTGVDYSLPKMDQAAIPDFSAGAMENWGLVTYRESGILFNPATGTTSQKQSILSVIAHEFTHQHFGNTVSPAWWHFLWLSEGFATLYAQHLLHTLYPTERWMDTYQVSTFMPVMETDANPNIRAMTHYVTSPREVERLFDNIAYSKSGSVLRMFQNAFGDATWSKGLNRYLTKMQYQSATSADLYAGIQKAVDEDFGSAKPDVARVMGSWELQSGFPYVTVTRNGNSLDFAQNRFMYDERNSENLWWIPVSYRIVGQTETDSSTAADFWIPNFRTFTLDGSDAPRQFTSSDLVLINYQQSGYYRVNYDTELWHELIDAINDAEKLSQIHIINRAQLIDDAFHLARANLVKYDILLGLMDYLEWETDYIPWIIASRANTFLARWVSGSKVHEHYKQMMQKNSKANFLHYLVDVVDNEQRVDRYARTTAINIACSFELPECLYAANQKLIDLLWTGTSAHQDLGSTIYCNGMRLATNATYNDMLARALSADFASSRGEILSAIGCANDGEIIANYFNLAIDAEDLSSADRLRMLGSVVNNGYEKIMHLLQFLSSNIVRINEKLINVQNLLLTVSNLISTEEMHDLFVDVVDAYVEAGTVSVTYRMIFKRNARIILDWQDANLNDLKAFFGFFTVTEEPTTTVSTSTTEETTTIEETTQESTTQEPTEQPTFPTYCPPATEIRHRCPTNVPGVILIPHPTNCARFLECDNGQGVVGLCESGLFFDAISSSCQPPDVGCCGRNTKSLLMI